MSSVEKITQRLSTRKLALVVIVIIIILVITAVVIAIAVTANSTNDKDITPVVFTECGIIKGVKSSSAYVFKGIPFAEPPVSGLRWKPPIPLSKDGNSCWQETLDAAEFGNKCVQVDPYSPTGISGNEDCLFLNVWTPTIDKTAKLPVMVWIHGGSLLVFSGNTETYCPSEELAVETSMVYVSMNYRLNAFGFMALENITGNYGFMDQQLALEWVQKNIVNFGGDPYMVTVLGHSSGATSAMALLASPLSTGLFHRAVLMGGSARLIKTSQEAAKDNLVFFHNTGCNDTECLRNLPIETIIQSIPWNVYPYWGMEDLNDLPTKDLLAGAIAVVDGVVLPEAPFEAWKNGTMAGVPVMIGNTAQELDYSPTQTDIKSWNWTDYVDKVTSKLSTFQDLNIDDVFQMYPSGRISPEYQYTSMASDIRVTCPLNRLSSKMNRTVYRYVVTSFPSAPVNFFGIPFKAEYSAHGLDIFGFFDTLKKYYTTTSKDDIFSDKIREEIVHFAKTGRPYTTEWQPYPQRTAVISDDVIITDAYHKNECDFWLQNGFFQYSWVN